MRRQRGSALILVLAVLASLVGLVAVFAGSQRASLRSLQVDLDTIRARELASAGLERALAELTTVDVNQVTTNDEWALLGEGNLEIYQVGEGIVRLEILDESSLVDINTADETQLAAMGLTTEQVDSILDWREPGLTPRAEGAKDEYYNSLPEPYNCGLAPFNSLNELLLVKGMTPVALFSRDPEIQTNVQLINGADEDQPVPYQILGIGSSAPWTGANGQPRLNVNTATVQQLVQRGFNQQTAAAILQRRGQVGGQFTTLGQVLTSNGINTNSAATVLNALTTNGATVVSGRLNLNTAGEAALNTLPGMTPDLNAAILTRQQQGFTQLGDLAAVPGATVAWLQQVADRFVVGSSVFRVRVAATFRSRTHHMEAWVSLANGQPTLLRTETAAAPDPTTLWLWGEESPTTVVLAE